VPPAAGRFSDELEAWSSDADVRTIASLGEVFGPRGFAVVVLVLMAPSATPLPTGGVTQVLEAVAVLVALQMVLGREELWLPASWGRRELGPGVTDKAIPWLVRVIRWFERFSRPRATWVFRRQAPRRLLGLLLITCVVFSVLAPPFSGLDTLPALGAVLIALAMLLEDAAILIAGVVVGAGGAVLIVTLGAAVVRFMRGLV
jgi:hypothetical protein